MDVVSSSTVAHRTRSAARPRSWRMGIKVHVNMQARSVIHLANASHVRFSDAGQGAPAPKSPEICPASLNRIEELFMELEQHSLALFIHALRRVSPSGP